MTGRSTQGWVNCLLVAILCLACLPASIQAASPAVKTVASGAKATSGQMQLPPLLGPEWPVEQTFRQTEPVWQASAERASTVGVSITEAGFDPEVVTVTVGTVVEWTNHTQDTVRLVGGTPYRVYLPLAACRRGN
jgi:plastocyanin